MMPKMPTVVEHYYHHGDDDSLSNNNNSQSCYRRSQRKTRTITTTTRFANVQLLLFFLTVVVVVVVVGGTCVVVSAFVLKTNKMKHHQRPSFNYYYTSRSSSTSRIVIDRMRITSWSLLFDISRDNNDNDNDNNDNDNDNQNESNNENDHHNQNTSIISQNTNELLSVAPMMGHTNRHYRYYYRLLSKKTYLYTEMIPSSQIVSAYNRAKEIYNVSPDDEESSSEEEAIITPPSPKEIINLVQKIIDNPSLEYKAAATSSKSLPYEVLTLHQLLSTSCSQESPVVLQLGGNNPITLGIASAIGAAWGRHCSSDSEHSHSHSQSHYISINLNCGCPSNAVGGRAGGCSLMATPELVLNCVDSMKCSIDEIYNTLMQQQQQQQSSKQSKQSKQQLLPKPTITVKHRLGIRDAISYNATFDRLQNDDEAFEEVSSFIRTVSSNDSVSTFHVHARLGILGDFIDDKEEEEEEEEDGNENNNKSNNNNNNKKKIQKQKQTLWVPTDGNTNTTDSNNGEIRIKIDHKREQEKARQRSRRSTIKNRDIPPLRPNVIYRLKKEFPYLNFVSNGGITTIREVKQVIDNNDNDNNKSNNNNNNNDCSSSVMGVMVGRTIINHPCSFASADQILWNNNESEIETTTGTSSSQKSRRRPTRGDILLDYIKYCDIEEDRILSYGASLSQMESLRRRLIAVPYHLFVGENGNDKYQRRIIKLKDKLQKVTTTTTTASSDAAAADKSKNTNTNTNTNTNKNNKNKNNNTTTIIIKASTILKGAMSFIPKQTLDKCINEYVEWDDIPKYDHLGGLKRGSALQRVIY